MARRKHSDIDIDKRCFLGRFVIRYQKGRWFFQWNTPFKRKMHWPHKAKYERYENGEIKQVGVVYYWQDKSLMIECVE